MRKTTKLHAIYTHPELGHMHMRHIHMLMYMFELWHVACGEVCTLFKTHAHV